MQRKPAMTALEAFVPCDHNKDGMVDFFDLLDFLNDWFGQAGVSDFNLDGMVDFFDLLDFLDCWFAG